MATTTRANLRKSLSERIGNYQSFAATANGNDAKTSLVSTQLRNFANGNSNAAFESIFFLGTSGANEGERGRCASYIVDASDGPTVILEDAFSNQTSSADTFEMHLYDPELLHVSISRALAEVFPTVYKPIRDETLIVDNILLNNDFETEGTAGTFANWTEVNSPTVTVETSRVFHGTNAAKVVAGSGAVGQLTQALDVNMSEVAGKTAAFKVRVWTDGASQARLSIDWGTSTETGEYHTGDSSWRLLSVEAAVPTDATQAQVICETAASQTAYFDTGWAAIDQVHRLTVPSSILRGPMHVLQQYNESMVDGAYYPLLPGETPTRGRILRLDGMGLLSRPTTESGTAELVEPQLNLVSAYAAMVLFQTMSVRGSHEQRQDARDNLVIFQAEVARLSTQVGIRMRPLGASRGKNSWHIEEDTDGRYLVFDTARRGAAVGSI
jgi:hypothetical protein